MSNAEMKNWIITYIKSETNPRKIKLIKICVDKIKAD